MSFSEKFGQLSCLFWGQDLVLVYIYIFNTFLPYDKRFSFKQLPNKSSQKKSIWFINGDTVSACACARVEGKGADLKQYVWTVVNCHYESSNTDVIWNPREAQQGQRGCVMDHLFFKVLQTSWLS